MKEQPEARAVILGEYIVRQKATVRAAAACGSCDCVDQVASTYSCDVAFY